MILHDISKDALTTPVYEGDPQPTVERIKSISFPVELLYASAFCKKFIPKKSPRQKVFSLVF